MQVEHYDLKTGKSPMGNAYSTRSPHRQALEARSVIPVRNIDVLGIGAA